MSAQTPITRVRVGYLDQVWGEIRLDAHGQPRFSGPRASAIEELYQSLLMTLAYRGLTPAEVLARMAQRLTGPTWATAAEEPPSNG